MTSIKLYKILQKHVGVINSLVVKLGNEELTKEEVKTEAIKNIKQILKDIK